MKDLLVAGALPAFAPAFEAAAQAVQQSGIPLPVFEPDLEAYDFWAGFLKYKSIPLAEVPGPFTQALGGKQTAAGLDREAFFFHYGVQGFHAAVDISPADLVPDGDVTVSVNVVAFRPADEDRNTFERLKSAQLRIDFAQEFSVVDVLDKMAWTAVALLRPDKMNKLPPIQTLSFDPTTAWKKMQDIVLPRGQGSWAINLYAQKIDGFFSQMLRILNKEIGRFAPVLGLPAISMIALQSFNEFYGMFHNKPEYLFQSNPVPVFATASALKGSTASRGLPLRTGTYVLVPIVHAPQLTPEKLEAFELKQGLIVPRNTTAVNVYSAAVAALPAVTYATLDVTVKPAQLPCGARAEKPPSAA